VALVNRLVLHYVETGTVALVNISLRVGKTSNQPLERVVWENRGCPISRVEFGGREISAPAFPGPPLLAATVTDLIPSPPSAFTMAPIIAKEFCRRSLLASLH
jgi:hypothetical protein